MKECFLLIFFQEYRKMLVSLKLITCKNISDQKSILRPCHFITKHFPLSKRNRHQIREVYCNILLQADQLDGGHRLSTDKNIDVYRFNITRFSHEIKLLVKISHY
jgi:hypothetical protein